MMVVQYQGKRGGVRGQTVSTSDMKRKMYVKCTSLKQQRDLRVPTPVDISVCLRMDEAHETLLEETSQLPPNERMRVSEEIEGN